MGVRWLEIGWGVCGEIRVGVLRWEVLGLFGVLVSGGSESCYLVE